MPCPCCGFETITDTYEICSVCFWENDPVQCDDPDYPSGANTISLRQAQINFEQSGASELRFLSIVRKAAEMRRNPNWKPLSNYNEKDVKLLVAAFGNTYLVENELNE